MIWYFMNNVEFNAGTDDEQRTPIRIALESKLQKWRWRVDDADTRFDNNQSWFTRDKEVQMLSHDCS